MQTEKTTEVQNQNESRFSLERFESVMGITNTTYKDLSRVIGHNIRSMFINSKVVEPMKNVVRKCCDFMSVDVAYIYMQSDKNPFLEERNITKVDPQEVKRIVEVKPENDCGDIPNNIDMSKLLTEVEASGFSKASFQKLMGNTGIFKETDARTRYKINKKLVGNICYVLRCTERDIYINGTDTFLTKIEYIPYKASNNVTLNKEIIDALCAERYDVVFHKMLCPEDIFQRVVNVPKLFAQALVSCLNFALRTKVITLDDIIIHDDHEVKIEDIAKRMYEDDGKIIHYLDAGLLNMALRERCNMQFISGSIRLYKFNPYTMPIRISVEDFYNLLWLSGSKIEDLCSSKPYFVDNDNITFYPTKDADYKISSNCVRFILGSGIDRVIDDLPIKMDMFDGMRFTRIQMNSIMRVLSKASKAVQYIDLDKCHDIDSNVFPSLLPDDRIAFPSYERMVDKVFNDDTYDVVEPEDDVWNSKRKIYEIVDTMPIDDLQDIKEYIELTIRMKELRKEKK